jgi:hypothetical protein
MKFEITKRNFRDTKIENLIIDMFKFYFHSNQEKIEKIAKSKDKEDLQLMLKELCDYVENGLKKKFSQNFTVLVNEHPNYAVKYERGYLLSLKYGNYDILIFKAPFICVPGLYSKEFINDEKNLIEEYEKKK